MGEPEPSESSPGVGSFDEPPKPSKKKAFIAIGIAAVVAIVVFGVIFPQLVDWNDVFDVLGSVEPLDLFVIFALGAIRWIPAGWIYALVLPGLSIKRGTQAWVATTGVSSTLPGFDLVLRVGMYRSWGFPLERTFSGMFLSGIVEMSTKLILAIFAVAAWGLARFDLNALAIAGIASLVVLAAAGLVALILRSEDRARQFGELVRRLVHWVLTKFSRQAPEDLVDRVLSVRLEAREVLGTRWPKAFLAAFIGQAMVYTILLLSVRAVGIESDVLTWTDVLIAYAVTTIITSIPISPGGIGIAELSLVGVFTLIAGRDVSPIATAAVILYRMAVWLLPIPVGWLATLRWQSTSGVRLFGGGSADTTEAAPSS